MVFVLPWLYVACPLTKLVGLLFGISMTSYDVAFDLAFALGVVFFNALLLGLLLAVGQMLFYARRGPA